MTTQRDVKAQLKERAATGTDVATTEPARRTIREMLEDPRQQAEIAKAIPNALTPKRFARLLLTAINSQPMLQECDALSLLAAGMQCASVGLEPNTPLQHCWLLPFRNNRENRWDVQFTLGYQGMVDLALRSPQVLSIAARSVYEHDVFEIDYGSDHLVHRPELDKEPGPIRFFYGIAQYPGGGRYFRAVPLWEIEEHRKMSKAPDSPAWAKHRVPMSLKTCIRIMWPFLPKTSEAAAAVAADDSTPEYGDWFDNDGQAKDEPITTEAREQDPARCKECGEVDGHHRPDCSQAPEQDAKPAS